MLASIIFVIAVGIVVYVIARQPDDFRITRSANMSASPSSVFEQVNDFHKWEAWSPWAKMDPACQNTFEGAASGKGAIFRWSGNRKVGQGNMTITESRSPDLILIRLEFLKPFKAVNTTEFTFKPAGEMTAVTWTMSGTNKFIGKTMSIIMNCEKMVGDQFEDGLRAMKAIVEKAK